MRNIVFEKLIDSILNNNHKKMALSLCNKQFLKAIKGADLIISTGGHHITTWLSKTVKTSQIYDLAVATLLGKKVRVWSQSIGPLNFKNEREKKYIQKLILRMDKIFIFLVQLKHKSLLHYRGKLFF